VPKSVGLSTYGLIHIARKFKKKKWKSAITYMACVVFLFILVNIPVRSKESDIAHSYYLLANAADKEGNLADAAKYYEKALGLDLKVHSLTNLGIIYSKQGNYRKSLDVFRRAIMVKPGEKRPYLNLGLSLKKLGRLEEAEKEYLKTIKISPGYTMGHYYLGNLYVEMNKKEKAIEAYKKAIRSDKHFLNAYYKLAREFKSSGHLDEEAGVLEKLLAVSKKKPKPIVYYRLREYYKNVSKDPEKAFYYDKMLTNS